MKLAKFVFAALGLATAFQVPGACSVYDESLVGGGGGAAGDSSTPGTCQPAKWPLKPAGTDLGGGNDFVTALTMFDFGEPYTAADAGGPSQPEWRDIGYDLDEACTIQTAADGNINRDPTMQDPSTCDPLGVPGQQPRTGDLPGGRDNGLRSVIELVQTVLSEFGTPAYNANIVTGRVSLLIGISDYNGQPDDDFITMTLYSPAEFNSIPENAGARPKFNGSDLWPILKESFDRGDPNFPSFKSNRAWVRDNVVVAAISELDLPLRIGISSQEVTNLQVRFNEPFLTARIGRDPETNLWKLTEGVIAARWATDDLFDMLSRFPNPDIYPRAPGPGENPFFCAGPAGYYPIIRQFICMSADIYSGGNAPGNPCDSLSVGIAFESIEARLGPVVDSQPILNPCGAANPAEDSCARVAQGLPPPSGAGDAGTDDGGS